MPRPLRAAVPGRLPTHIHSSEEAGLSGVRLHILRTLWRFPFHPGLILARPDLEGLFILNETAAYLYSLVCQGLTSRVLVERFCDSYGIGEDQAASDIAATLEFWITRLLDIPRSEAAPSLERPVPPAFFAFSEHYQVNGTVVRVCIGDPELTAEISPRLLSVQTAGSDGPCLTFRVWRQHGRVFLWYEGVLLASEENPNAVRAILLQEIVRRTEPRKNWLAILHAGACGLGHGVLLLAGPSQAGKTTLCAALMASGFTFYADDSAAIGDDGTVTPMPFRLMVREGSWKVLHPLFPELLSSPPAEHSGHLVRFLTPPPEQVASGPRLAKALLFVGYRPGEKTSLRSLPPFETVLKMQESGFWVQHDRASIAAMLAWLEMVPAYELTYSDLGDAIAALRRLAGNAA